MEIKFYESNHQAMLEVNLQEIKSRSEKLDFISKELKKHFVGIDAIIDDLLDYIKIWYLMPDILTRPIIVNLWGMTGVGKTDLVRKMISLLEYQDRFVEVELSNGDSTNYQTSVAGVFAKNGMSDGKPFIVLFDEIQRFNTLEIDGKPLQNTKFTDFWELLSDGKLAKREREDLEWLASDILFNKRDMQKRKDRGEEVDEQSYNTLGLWEANNFKQMLGMEETAIEIAEMGRMGILERIQKAQKKKKVYEPIDYSKTLIIISGNLDDAFSMSTSTSESDIDADIFHAFTRKISIVNVKDSLARRFKPEQVARFGNIHLIYKSLRKVDFQVLIKKEIEKVSQNTEKRFGIKIKIKENINRLIYDNGVFPVQGVRPVFSSVIDILETNLAKFLFEALMKGEKSVEIDYDYKQKAIVAKIGKTETIVLPYVGRIDRVRATNIQDVVANVSVHESGHAVAYCVLFGLVPLQLKSRIAHSHAAGFTFPHEIFESKENMIKKIKVYLAGGLAEEIIFGKENATSGRSHDREMVTILAVDYVRKYGFDEEFQANYAMEFAYAMDKTATDMDVEKMVARYVSETNQLLMENKAFLTELSQLLNDKGNLEPKVVVEIAQKYAVKAIVKEEGYLAIESYDALLVGKN